MKRNLLLIILSILISSLLFLNSYIEPNSYRAGTIEESSAFASVAAGKSAHQVSNVEAAPVKLGDIREGTLITCYPFDYVGLAPKRLIVRGSLKQASEDVLYLKQGFQ